MIWHDSNSHQADKPIFVVSPTVSVCIWKTYEKRKTIIDGWRIIPHGETATTMVKTMADWRLSEAWSISGCEFWRAWPPIRRSPNQLTFMFSERYVCYSNLQAGEETQRTPTPPQSSSYCRHCYSCYVLNSSIAEAEGPALQWMACTHGLLTAWQRSCLLLTLPCLAFGEMGEPRKDIPLAELQSFLSKW